MELHSYSHGEIEGKRPLTDAEGRRHWFATLWRCPSFGKRNINSFQDLSEPNFVPDHVNNLWNWQQELRGILTVTGIF